MDLPAMKAGCPCTVPLSSWGLSGHQQYQAGTCSPHGGGGVQLCCHPSPSTAPFSIHTQSTWFAPSRGSPGPCHQQPWLSSCSSSTEHQQTPTHRAKHPPPSQARPQPLTLGEPDLARAHPPLPAWRKLGMEGMVGERRKREQTLSPQTSKSSSAGAFGTV